jgi:hypothetical protein
LWATTSCSSGNGSPNLSKSNPDDKMKVESVAGNQYALDLHGCETIAADGTG